MSRHCFNNETLKTIAYHLHAKQYYMEVFRGILFHQGCRSYARPFLLAFLFEFFLKLIIIFTQKAPLTLKWFSGRSCIRSNWNLEMLSFEAKGKPENPERNLSGQRITNNQLNPLVARTRAHCLNMLWALQRLL